MEGDDAAGNGNVATPSPDLDQASHLHADASSFCRYKSALQRFLAVSKRRKRHFQALQRPSDTQKIGDQKENGDEDDEKQSTSTAQKRMFIISENEEPWNVFTSGSPSTQALSPSGFMASVRMKRLVFEWSDLHFSSLHSACASGDRPLVRKLLQHESCSLARDAGGRIPLHHAAIREQLKILTLLLRRPDARLQVHVRDNSGYSATHYVLFKLMALAHRRYPQCQSASTALHMRRVSKRYRRLSRTADEMLRLVSPMWLSDGGDASTNRTDDLDFSLRALDWRCRGDGWDATRSGDLERLKFLFQVYYKADLDDTTLVLSELRQSMLHEACDRQHVAVLYYLVTHQQQLCRVASKHLRDASGCTALHYAAMRGFLEGCVVLLEEKQDTPGGNGDGQLYGEHEDDTEALCLAVDTRGRTALHWSLLANQQEPSSREAQRAPVIKYLVAKCVSALHVVDDDGFTPLHVAIWRGDLEIVELFVQLGANVNIVSSCLGEAARVDDAGKSTKAVKATAPWAPCGARFHGDHRKSIISHMATSKIDQESDNHTDNGADCETMLLAGYDQEEGQDTPDTIVEGSTVKRTSSSNPQDEENAGGNADGNSVVMETLKYWLRKDNKKRFDNNNKVDENQHDVPPITHPANPPSTRKPQRPHIPEAGEAPCDDDNDDTSARGCRKYGGVCPQCSNHSGCAASCSKSSVLSPLVLAIRACRRDLVRGNDRAAIVELLLLSGADPNESASRGSKKTSSCPLIEALYASTACPQIVSLLLSHGAKRVCVRQLERFCRSLMTCGASTTEVDTALLGIVDALDLHEHDDQRTSASSPLSAFFEARCFNSLTRLLYRHHRHCAALDQDDIQADTRSLCLWRAIRSGLSESSPTSRLAARSQRRLDREHLWFLCEYLKRNQQQSSVNQEEPQCRDNAELKEFLQHCLDRCLTTWRHHAKVTLVEDHERLEQQQMVSKCMELLRFVPNHEFQERGRDSETKPGNLTVHTFSAQWLDHCIALGFFDSALVLLDNQLTNSHCSVGSMDHLLRVYGDEGLANRHHLLGCLSHEDFFVAMVEKCITAIEWTVAVQPDTSADIESQSPIVRFSIESFVRACAYNLSMKLVRKIWRLIGLTNTNTNNSSRLYRVGGKTLVEWLVHHRRRDLIEFLLESGASTRPTSLLLWRDCISAAVAACDSETDKRELLSWLLSLYPSSLEGGGTADVEELKMIEWLTLNRAVRCDSPLLFTIIIEPLWTQVTRASCGPKDTAKASETSDEEPPTLSTEQQIPSDTKALAAALSSTKSLFSRLLRIRFFHQVARWNALKLATYLIDERFTAVPLSDDRERKVTTDQWRDVLLGLRGDDEEQAIVEASSPLAICCSLGHVTLAQLFVRSTGAATAMSVFPPELQDIHAHGLFSSLMRLNAQVQALHSPPYGKGLVMVERLKVFQSVDQWQVACRCNLVTHLDALQLHSIPVSTTTSTTTAAGSLQAIPALLLLAITAGSLDALQWLLVNELNNINSINEAVIETLYEAASKHPSDLYALMTLLLLDHIPYSGRLAGDGNNVTLLHRCVCFLNPQLMRRAVDKVLSIPGSSVNVLDAFGNSPAVYACMSGNLSSLCYLVSSKNARLEAEYEGQASFYYALQLLPCFAWRFVIEKLLMTEKCKRCFLHCDGGAIDDKSCTSSCGCKGFERAAQEGEALVCGFCGHDAEHHRKIPFPPWFMDQYETYVGKAAAAISSEQCDSESDREGDERGRILEGPSANEVTLEEERGRLNIAALTAITLQKYAAIVEEYELPLDCESTDGAQGMPLAWSSEAGEARFAENSEVASLSQEKSSWLMVPLKVLSEQEGGESKAQQASESVGIQDPLETASASKPHEDQLQQLIGGDGDLNYLPLHLYKELKRVHPLACCCHNPLLITTTYMWKYEIVSSWLHFFANHWSQRNSATTRATRATQVHVLQSSHWALRVAFARWRNDIAQQQRHVALQLETRLSNNRRLMRTLQQVLSHWRFANAFLAFQRWKHASASAQVRHMHLQALVEQVDAQMRRTRLETLREKHRQLQKRIAHL